MLIWFAATNFQQAHQKNQLKDTIDVDEPEGTSTQLLPHLSSCCLLHHFTSYLLITDHWYLEMRDPLTAEELEEKERLLEEVKMEC